MAVLRALWSELEDFEANHLNSDCFLKEEPSLYWKVWPMSLTEKPSPVQILIYDVADSVSAQYFHFYIRKPCSLIQIRKPQHFWYVHMITSIKKESAKEDSGLLSWIPSRRLSKHL